MKNSILLLIFFFTISCSSNDKDVYKNDKSLYENNLLKDYELFKLANDYINTNQFKLALVELDKIEVLYPSSSYAKKSMLLTAYIYFLEKDYEKTRAIAEMYKNYYPGDRDIVYANYLEAMTYYVLMKKYDYSQENTHMALEKFNFILNAYPNSDYEIDIITKIQIIQNNLADHKLVTAKYYLDKENKEASLIYLKEIFENHSDSIYIAETLYLITKIYHEIDEKELARKYASILAYNFPNNFWYEQTYNILNDLEINELDEKWYEKFNPIKILVRNREKNTNTSIQPIE